MKRFRLTKVSKILIMVLVVAALCGAGFFLVKSGFVKSKDNTNTDVKVETTVADKTENKKPNPNKETTQNKTETVNDKAINLSLDEWIG